MGLSYATGLGDSQVRADMGGALRQGTVRGVVPEFVSRDSCDGSNC